MEEKKVRHAVKNVEDLDVLFVIADVSSSIY